MGHDANVDEPSFFTLIGTCMLSARGSKFHYLCKYMKTIPFLNEKLSENSRGRLKVI
jgi:hypothetical protein